MLRTDGAKLVKVKPNQDSRWNQPDVWLSEEPVPLTYWVGMPAVLVSAFYRTSGFFSSMLAYTCRDGQAEFS